MNKLQIMDYAGRKVDTDIDLDDLSNIQTLIIEVVSGDEILSVITKDGRNLKYDSSDCRTDNFYDGSYTLYDTNFHINLINHFLKRKNSYEILNEEYDMND